MSNEQHSIGYTHLRRESGHYPVAHQFVLPYIVQPEGCWRHTLANQDWQVTIKLIRIPQLFQTATGFRFDPEKPMRVDGPQEIFLGVSNIEVVELTPPKAIVDMDEKAIYRDRNLIAAILNDIQNRYLYVSGRYWRHEISADHIVNLQTNTRCVSGMSTKWGGGSGRALPSWRQDDGVITEFTSHLKDNPRLLMEDVFLTDARRHYLTGEYHLMYVEIATAFEAVTERSYRALSSIYEQQMFKEGKLAGRVAHLLHTHRQWNDEEIKSVIAAIQARNEVVHHGKRRFNASDCFNHIEASIRAVRSIVDWLNERSAAENQPQPNEFVS
jgi:hypothetical protein